MPVCVYLFCSLPALMLMALAPCTSLASLLNVSRTAAVSSPLSYNEIPCKTRGPSKALPGSLDYTGTFLPVTVMVCSTA